MSGHPVKRETHPQCGEEVTLEGHYRKKNQFVALFLICCAVLIAGFALTSVFAENGARWFVSDTAEVGTNEVELPAESESDSLDVTSDTLHSDGERDPLEGIPVCALDLSYTERGKYYMINESIYSPDVDSLLEYDLSEGTSGDPLVLILHTHTSEAYIENTDCLLEEIGVATYSDDETRNVLSVGKILCEALNQNGISAIHCKTYHDDGMSGAYARAADTIRFFLMQYPTIRYVIDLHRDSILTSDGKYVRAVTQVDGEDVAQVMCVVGSSGAGMACDGWQENLALALQLRERMNADGMAICRPVTLRNSTYNQDLAPRSLLLEIGTGGNTAEEARRAAVIVGKALSELLVE